MSNLRVNVTVQHHNGTETTADKDFRIEDGRTIRTLADATQYIFEKVTRIGTWANMLGFTINKVTLGGVGSYAPITDLREEISGTYKVKLAAVLEGERPYPIERVVTATSGNDAKMKVWNEFKDGGLGRAFCSMAATLVSLTVTVERRNSDEVIYERSASAAAPLPEGVPPGSVERTSDRPGQRLFVLPCSSHEGERGFSCGAEIKTYVPAPAGTDSAAEDLSGNTRVYGDLRVSVDAANRNGRIVNTATGAVVNVNATQAWEGYRNRMRRFPYDQNMRFAYDWITNYIPQSAA